MPTTEGNLQAAVQSVLGGTGLREAARRFKIAPCTLSRHVKRARSTSPPKKNGRPFRLTPPEETTITKSVSELMALGAPISRQQLKSLAKIFIDSLPQQRQREIGFKENTPGRDWVTGFLSRHSLVLKTKQSLERPRYDAMTVNNLAAHFAQLEAIYEKYSINCPSQIFNLTETGFSLRGAVRGKTKVLVPKGEKANAVTLKTSGNVDHVTVMPVVSADGKVWNPAVVLKGKRHRERKKVNGAWKTLRDFFPPGAYIYLREDVASMDSDIFALWASEFVKETSALRERKGSVLVILDGMGAHLQHEAMKTFNEAGIVVIALPAHASHALQPLDISVFASTKEKFRQLLSPRTISTRRDLTNDIFVVAEMITRAYDDSLSIQNIRSGFKKSGIWPLDIEKALQRGDVRTEDGTENVSDAASTEGNSEACVRQSFLFRHRELRDEFRRRHGVWNSDGLVPGTSHVTTKSGATITSDNFLAARRAQEEEKRRKEAAKLATLKKRKRKEIYPETHEEIKHLLELCEGREARRRLSRWRARSRAKRAPRWEQQ